MTSGILGIASSGLMAFQRSMTTISHNISNVNTAGYSRQSTGLAAVEPQFMGSAGYLGNGVDINSVRRSYDAFLTSQVRTSTTASSELDTYQRLASQVDNFVSDQDSSLPPAMQAFFSSIHNVINEPTSVPVRQAMLTSAQTMANRFNVMNQTLDNIRAQMDQSYQSSIDEVNALAGNLADINGKIVEATGRGGGNPPNDLLDQRDQLLLKLAKHMDLQVVPQTDGSVNVLIGSGQALVMGTVNGKLALQNSAYGGGAKEIALYASGSTNYAIITKNISGGDIGGMMSFDKQFLTPAQNDLGRIAASFSAQFNEQHLAGYGLDGTQNAFFNTLVPGVLPKAGNTGTLTASFPAAASQYTQLTGADYQVDVGATGWTITNLRNNTTVTQPAATTSFTYEGVTFDVSAANAGDSYLVEPTRNAAAQFKLALTDPGKIAASKSNTTIPAVPPGGPTVGDNLNALALANMQSANNMLNGKGTYDDAYNQIVGQVGNLTSSAETNATAQKSLLDQVTQQQASVSGVNLDEEAANLIMFQQAYQAAAQMIATAKSTFDTLIGAVRS